MQPLKRATDLYVLTVDVHNLLASEKKQGKEQYIQSDTRLYFNKWVWEFTLDVCTYIK